MPFDPAAVPAVVVTLDKQSYQVGEAIMVTVEYPDPGNPGKTLTVTAMVHGTDGTTATGTATAQVGATPAQPLQVSVSDSFSGTYSLQSNANGTAVLTGTVVAPPPGA